MTTVYMTKTISNESAAVPSGRNRIERENGK